ncbi:PAS domain-containing protein [Enterovirga sp.]|uniref:PAS domain-containing protein n=1 Tax=Enterovirga sp. TaxID=2026350 RepID=UPI002B9885B6|nr:PAS domain-containing protein [Enterovirga sp.]HMO29112.1 PAS domain-containing protein [Enterovirga sp.]
MSALTDPLADAAWSESERLAALSRYGILDTEREAEFDDIVRIATRLFGVPVALVSFLASDRQWFKAEIGLGLREAPLELSICKEAIRRPGIFAVPDLAADPRYRSHPFVAGENGLRFYASARLTTPDGRPLGTVCVIDRKPRPGGLAPDEEEALGALARQVMSHLELRRAVIERDRALSQEKEAVRRYALLAAATRDAIWDWDIDRDVVRWNEALHETYGYRLDEVGTGSDWWQERIHPDDRERVLASIHAVEEGSGSRWAAEYRFRQADGSYADILDRGSLIRDEDGRARRMIGAMLDLTEPNRASRRRSAMAELGERLRDLDDPSAMAFAAAEAMGRTLHADRAGHAAVDAEGETVEIVQDWLSPGGRSFPGRLRLRDFGGFVDDLKRGETVVVSDAETDPRTASFAPALHAIGIRSLVNLPVLDQGRLVAIFYLNEARARTWSEGDLSFVRNVADATLAAMTRARSMAALRASEELFRVFAQAMPNQVWAADAEGRIDWLNQQAIDYFDFVPPLTKASWSAMLHPDDRDQARTRWRQTVARGEVFEIEFRLRRRDGSYRWFLSRALPIRGEGGVIGRWIGTNTDVHEQKETAEALARANSLLASRVEERTRERDRLWSTTSDLMGTAGPDGSLTSVNPAWTRMLGWPEKDLLSTPSLDLVVEEERGEVGRVVSRLGAGEAIEGFVCQLRTRDGSARTVMWSAVPDRGVVYFVGRDITDQRETEEQLRQAQKMEAVGQLTGGIAHDFNNLLTGIIGSLDLLQTRMRQGRTEGLERYLQAATTSAKRAAALTHRLLAFARRQPVDPKPVDASALICSLEDLLRRTIGEAIGLRIVGEPGLWPVLCDPNQLESAILNLAINARDVMPGGGELRIETANTFLDGVSAPVHAGIDPGPFVRISVTDTGTGMPPDILKKAFEPFFTTKPIGQGTGLGLSMVYGFARQSGGQAMIASEPGRGTTVTILLPRHRGEAPSAAGGDSAAPAAPAARGETVLVVEDELIVRDLVVEVLTEMGLRVLKAVDGPSGLRVLQGPERIDLLVSDIGLPAMNGRQMAEEGRRARPGLPVLFITGYAENATLKGFLAPGMEMITKPFSVDVLVSRVRAMLEGAARAAQ